MKIIRNLNSVLIDYTVCKNIVKNLKIKRQNIYNVAHEQDFQRQSQFDI